ncbi:hypothetical protein, partial [Ruminococcus bromii]|uniref:hypothetical protein n=1 Tax=Ruminococcus bromii TaxID=40518 RepID=UPI003AB86688
LKSFGKVNLSISASVIFIKAPLPTFFWIEAVPIATKLSFTARSVKNGKRKVNQTCRGLISKCI